MKITTIDKGTAEAITSRLHDAVRDVADSMGVTVYVERTKFSTVEMSVTFSIKLPADKTEFPHYVYDDFAEREGVEFDGYDDRLDSDGVDRWDAVEEYMNKTFGEARLAVMRSLLEKFRAMERSLDSRTAGVILKVYVLALNPKNISLLPAAVEALRKAISE